MQCEVTDDITSQHIAEIPLCCEVISSYVISVVLVLGQLAFHPSGVDK